MSIGNQQTCNDLPSLYTVGILALVTFIQKYETILDSTA